MSRRTSRKRKAAFDLRCDLDLDLDDDDFMLQPKSHSKKKKANNAKNVTRIESEPGENGSESAKVESKSTPVESESTPVESNPEILHPALNNPEISHPALKNPDVYDKMIDECFEREWICKAKDVALTKNDLVVKHFFDEAVKRIPPEEIVATPDIADFFPPPDKEAMEVSRKYSKDMALKSDILDVLEAHGHNGDDASAIDLPGSIINKPANPDIVKKLRQDLAEAQNRNRLLQRQMNSLVTAYSNRADLNHNADEFLKMLPDIPTPKLNRKTDFREVKGFRIFDTNTLSVALKKALECRKCLFQGGSLDLTELNPEFVQEGAGSQFAFTCSKCTKATVFTNSPFSQAFPANYSINKHLMSLLGPKPYYKLVKFLRNGDSKVISKRTQMNPAQFLLSIDQHQFTSGAKVGQELLKLIKKPAPKPPELPLPTRLPQFPSQQPINNLSPFNRLPLPPSLQTFALPQNPIPQVRAPINPVFRPNGGGPPGGGIPAPKAPIKLKPSADLPAGSKITRIPPGTRIKGDIRYKAQEDTGLTPGTYRVLVPNGTERFLIIRYKNAMPVTLPVPLPQPRQQQQPLPVISGPPVSMALPKVKVNENNDITLLTSGQQSADPLAISLGSAAEIGGPKRVRVEKVLVPKLDDCKGSNHDDIAESDDDEEGETIICDDGNEGDSDEAILG